MVLIIMVMLKNVEDVVWCNICYMYVVEYYYMNCGNEMFYML